MNFSICKGPEWKPGIFVQFTKEGGIARESGLRPGDQILFCNNVDFSDIPFNEVNYSSLVTDLEVISNRVNSISGSELNENGDTAGLGREEIRRFRAFSG